MPDSVATKVTKAVVPAAGLGTRFLPATKATPKEMLPVVDKPAIQYVVEEAVAAGLNDVLMITGRSKRSIEDHFDRNYELEEALIAKGDDEGLALIRDSAELATVHYVRQGDPKGLGHAVSCAAKHVGREPFAVLLGDDFIHPDDRLLQRMLEVREQMGGSVVALMQVERDQVSSYGTAAIEPTDEDDVVKITDLVEKPARKTRPATGSSLAATSATQPCSRYWRTPRRDAAARSSSPMRSRPWRGWTRPTAAACTACCSAAGGTTPATRWTTCAP